MTKLTIVVPYDGQSTALEETLVSLLENRPDESEIMVVLNCAYENTYDLDEDEVCFMQNPVPESERFFESAVHSGILRSAGEIVHIVPCGSLVESGWADAAVRLFVEPRVACVIPLLRKTPCGSAVLTQGFHFSQTGDLLPISDQTAVKNNCVPHVPHPFGVFFRREAYLAAGGLDMAFGGTLAVVDLALEVCENGGKIASTTESALSVPEYMLYPDGPEKTRQQVSRLFWKWNFSKRPLAGLKTLMAKWLYLSGKRPKLHYEM